MKTYTLTDEERTMIVEALRAHEGEFNCGTPDDEAYFAKVLALADQIEDRNEDSRNAWYEANKVSRSANDPSNYNWPPPRNLRR